MSISVALQDFILDRLKTSAGVAAHVSDRIYDQPPASALFPYISFGASDFTTDRFGCIDGREETLQLDIWHRDQGRMWPCKATTDAVVKALDDVDAEIGEDGSVAHLRVGMARCFMDQDGITAHGVVQVSALID